MWVFGKIDGLRWVHAHSTMAFANHAANRIRKIRERDQAVLYVTGSAYKGAETSRLAGIATVMGSPAQRDAVEITGRPFTWFVPIKFELLLEERTGPEVKELADSLDLVRFPGGWGGYFRPSPVSINAHDFQLMKSALEKHPR